MVGSDAEPKIQVPPSTGCIAASVGVGAAPVLSGGLVGVVVGACDELPPQAANISAVTAKTTPIRSRFIGAPPS